ncbi:MAG: GTP cyclohydrolase II [Alphaproteobacteria bacterium]|nr:GTP cyclohydrolase II [Alphaproteobacteria bacterium]
MDSAVPDTATQTAAARVASTLAAAGTLRRGLPLALEGPEAASIILSVETATDDQILAVDRTSPEPGLLILTHPRAATLKIRLYTPDVVAVRREPGWSSDHIRAIADPTSDLASPLKGPFSALRAPLPLGAGEAVKLAKLAGLLPAVLLWPHTQPEPALARITADVIRSYDSDSVAALRLVTRARVPLEGAPDSEIAAFRPAGGGPEHYAIIINSPAPHDPVLTRLHSECFTGDLLGSLKCDCGQQLRGAIAAIAAAGGGILLYLAQEGRGIGLINKLRAYRLQDQGFDTVEANERLGFASDERLYGVAARMLALLGYNSVRLLTNNPDKLAGLAAAGVEVVERVPHIFASNPHNDAYLRTKAEKAGHLF